MESSKRVLIVDDDRDQLYMLGLLLKDQNYEVVEAISGQTGLEILKDTPVDLVVTDITMPGMDGIEFAGLLKKMKGNERTPVVLVTAGREAVDFSSRPFRVEGFCLKKDIYRNLVPSIRSLLC